MMVLKARKVEVYMMILASGQRSVMVSNSESFVSLCSLTARNHHRHQLLTNRDTMKMHFHRRVKLSISYEVLAFRERPGMN